MGDIGDPSTAPWPGDHHDATVAIPGAENLVGCLGRRRKAGDRPEIADRAHESCSGGTPQHLCDIVLVMTVNPGFSGQTFLPEVLPKSGALHSALCKKLKWKRCSRRLARAAKIAGLKLKATRVEGGEIRFEIAR
jgi:hypothetical protein